jgi:hypothetical protein
MQKRAPRSYVLGIGLASAFLSALLPSARAGLFNVTYDASTSGAPADFFTAFDSATQFLQSLYADPITINMQVGWGKINGNNLAPGNLGQSLTNQQGFYSYAQMKTALTNDKTTASDITAVANLPAVDPYGGTKFVMSNGEAKALGLLAGNAAGTDGFVGFNSAATWTFDPNNRAVTGKVDFIGVALHEITEVMGRYGLTQNGAANGRYSPIDLFRYTSAGNLALTPVNGTYFSIDAGTTPIHTFNGTGGGDLSDWSGATNDSFNASSNSGVLNPMSADDIKLMDVIGYNLVPEPSTLALATFGFIGLAAWGWRRKELRYVSCEPGSALGSAQMENSVDCF